VSVPKNHLLQKLKRIGEKFQSESDYAFSYKNKLAQLWNWGDGD